MATVVSEQIDSTIVCGWSKFKQFSDYFINDGSIITSPFTYLPIYSHITVSESSAARRESPFKVEANVKTFKNGFSWKL